ncbi:family 20 glycosylhydrolase (plasmid) [Pseudoalteromonas sp. T1lg65]|uniref:family 20 glycosylhydrolase n=1 Tax=Pseudoalteromonas sp. T1lg65 TaxID=2077101 RepID=UPI003F7A1DC6
MKPISSILLSCFAFGACHAHASLSQSELNDLASKLDWNWAVIDNHHNGAASHLQELELVNHSSTALPAGKSDWQIYFNSLPPLKNQQVKGLQIEFVQGDVYRLVPTDEFKGLKAGETLILPYEAGNSVVSFTDFFPRVFIVQNGLTPAVIASTDTEVQSEYVKPITKPQQYERYATPKDHWQLPTGEWRYNRYLAAQKHAISAEQAKRLIVPTPERVEYSSRSTELNANWSVSYQGSVKSEMQYLLNELKNKLGINLAATADHIPAADKQVIKMTVDKKVANGVSGSYMLNIDSKTIEIIGADNAGVFYGIQSLLSVIPAGVKSAVDVPRLTAIDSPRYQWRGFMYDMGRNFHGVEVTKQLIDQMSRYKLNKLHLHLTEDEAWRIEINGLPELTELGSKRCFDLSETKCLLPTRGAGPFANGKNDGYYSKADFIEILKYAAQRHIEVIPEIDMPGHARAAIKSMELRYKKLMAAGKETQAKAYLLSDPEDKSVYSTMQYFTDNSINVCMDSTYSFVDKVAYELQQMYREAGLKLNTLHIGGDEVGPGSWTKSPICDQLFAQPDSGVKGPADLKAYFTARASKLLGKRGLDIGAWEDGLMYDRITPFPIEQFDSENVYANAWDNIWEWGVADRAYRLANAGYKAIISAGTHLYLDHPQEPDPKERGLYWASRYTDVEQVYGFMPDDIYANADYERSGKPIENLEDLVGRAMPKLEKPENIVGMQGQIWTETIRTPEQLTEMLFPRLIALGERAWHKAEWEADQKNTVLKTKQWGQFASVIALKEYPKLAEAGLNYYVPVPGAKKIDGKIHVLSQLPGLILEYSTDGGQDWQQYQGPIDTDQQILVRAKSGEMISRVGRSD